MITELKRPTPQAVAEFVDRLVELRDAGQLHGVVCLYWHGEARDPCGYSLNYSGVDTVSETDTAIAALERAKWALIGDTMEDE